MRKKPFEHKPITKMSYVAGIHIIWTFIHHERVEHASGAPSFTDVRMSPSLLYVGLPYVDDDAAIGIAFVA